MKMKNSEILDRWTILLMKSRFSDPAKAELEVYEKEVVEIYGSAPAHKKELYAAICNLMEANAKIWQLEASIRKEFTGDIEAQSELTLSEIGKRAIQIRDHNALRIKAKTVIDSIFGDAVDVKVDHASACHHRYVYNGSGGSGLSGFSGTPGVKE